MMKFFVCNEEAENILCGIYDAWADEVPNKDCRILVGDVEQPELFSTYVFVETDEKKVQKVIRSIRKKLGYAMWRSVERGLLAASPKRGELVFRFLIYGFYRGENVLEELSVPAVMDLFELNRATTNEAHYYNEFTRFERLKNGSLFAEIEPKAQVLPMIISHFAERLNTEHFLILDRRHGYAAAYTPEEGWYFLKGEDVRGEVVDAWRQGGDIYTDLWKIFFDTIAIEARKNPRCQQNHCALHYRKYMTEFLPRTEAKGVKKNQK